MKVELTYDTPEPSWLSIKQQIEAIPDFCDEVTLQVSKPIFAGDRVFRFVDRAGIPIPTSQGPDPYIEPNLFVEWVHDEFRLRELKSF
jgi:hypothetical protein